MGFWDLIWYFLMAFAYIAYLCGLFFVFIDLFRDKDLGGGAKALWVIFLIFVPLIALLVYVIARGKGMAARSNRERYRDPAAEADQYMKEAAASKSPAEEIRTAKILLDDDMITLAEYNTLKAQALSGASVPASDGTPVR